MPKVFQNINRYTIIFESNIYIYFFNLSLSGKDNSGINETRNRLTLVSIKSEYNLDIIILKFTISEYSKLDKIGNCILFKRNDFSLYFAMLGQ